MTVRYPESMQFSTVVSPWRSAPPPGPVTFCSGPFASTFRLGSAPNGPITAHVKGDATGGSYAEDAASLMPRIAMRSSGLSLINRGAFAALALAAPMATGFFAARETTLLSALDILADSIGAHFGFDRQGQFTVGRLTGPQETAGEFPDESDIISLEREPSALPIWRQKIGYARYWRSLSDSESAAALDAEARSDLAEPHRYADASDPAIQTHHKLADDAQRDGLLATEADAATEAARRLAFSEKRGTCSSKIKNSALQPFLGTTIRISYPRHGLAAGRTLVLVGLSEDSAFNEAELTLWG